jgi:hypothetical protein
METLCKSSAIQDMRHYESAVRNFRHSADADSNSSEPGEAIEASEDALYGCVDDQPAGDATPLYGNPRCGLVDSINVDLINVDGQDPVGHTAGHGDELIR